MWDKLSQGERITLIIGCLILIVGIYYLSFYQPMQSEIKNLRQEKKQKELRLAAGLSLVKKLPKVRVRYNQLKLKDEEVKEKVGSLTMEGILQLLEESAQKSRVKITSLTPKEGKDDLKLNLLVKGNYANLTDFLAGLKSLGKGLRSNSLSIQPTQGELYLRLNLVYHKENGGGLN